MDRRYAYSYTPRSCDYTYCTMKDLLDIKTQQFPDIDAFIHYTKDKSRDAITYKDLNMKANCLAGYLVSLGISKGDRVALLGPNTISRIVGELGIIFAGAVVIHLNMMSSDASDAIEIMTSANCKMIILDPGEGDELLRPMTNIIDFMRTKETPDMQTQTNSPISNVLLLKENLTFSFCQTLDSVMISNDNTSELPIVFPEDPMVIFVTSGSTGKPKMVQHTHFNIINIQFGVPSTEDGIEIRKLYCDRPFGWLGGSPLVSLCIVESRVFTDTTLGVRGESVTLIWDIIRSENCTYIHHVPYFLADLLTFRGKVSDSFKVKAIVTGGQVVTKHHMEVLGVYCETIYIIYASTEGLIAASNKISDLWKIPNIGDLGLPLPDAEIKVINTLGHVTKRGVDGEICIRSRVLFNGYLNTNQKTFANGGWFKTGDMGCVSREGHVIIKGRLKDVISRGTRKIMPASIENVVMTMAGLEKVVVLPIPDERLYEEVCLCYVPTVGHNIREDDVKEFCRTKFVAENSVDGLGDMPKYFLRFDSFPVFPNGKTNVSFLKSQAISRITS